MLRSQCSVNNFLSVHSPWPGLFDPTRQGSMLVPDAIASRVSTFINVIARIPASTCSRYQVERALSKKLDRSLETLYAPNKASLGKQRSAWFLFGYLLLSLFCIRTFMPNGIPCGTRDGDPVELSRSYKVTTVVPPNLTRCTYVINFEGLAEIQKRSVAYYYKPSKEAT